MNRHIGIPTILIIGGSQGSHVINLAVEECLKKLLLIACVIHQTGDSKYRDFERLYLAQNNRYLVRKWIDDMGYVLKSVDFVVSRAGINTLTELAYLGKPALVIPLPYIFADEQNKNAKYFEKLGLVTILPQRNLSGSSLLASIKSCLRNLNDLKKSAKKAKAATAPDAGKRVAQETILLAHG